MKIKISEDAIGCYDRQYKKGEVIEYDPWPHKWRGMDEPERVAKGLYVLCCGHGEFDILRGEPAAVSCDQ